VPIGLIAAGPVETTFTPENLQGTYGGRMTLLSQAASAYLEQRPRAAAAERPGLGH
jgi:manganese/zinc/iron transport system ATP- binding protein